MYFTECDVSIDIGRPQNMDSSLGELVSKGRQKNNKIKKKHELTTISHTRKKNKLGKKEKGTRKIEADAANKVGLSFYLVFIFLYSGKK